MGKLSRIAAQVVYLEDRVLNGLVNCDRIYLLHLRTIRRSIGGANMAVINHVFLQRKATTHCFGDARVTDVTYFDDL